MSGISSVSPPSNTERILSFSVHNLSQLDGTKLSEKLRVDGLLWRMMVLQKEVSSSSQGGSSKVLGVYLQRISENTVTLNEADVKIDSEADVKASITLVNQDNPLKSYTKEFKYTFTATSTDWGYTTFIKWKDLTNASRGFLKDDTIILQADITVLRQQQPRKALANTETNSSILSCPKCGIGYLSQGKQQPLSLKCGHTFCFECLDGVCTSVANSKSNVVCSICQQEHSADKRDDLWFPNHSVIQMIGNVIPKSKFFCDVHQQNMDYYCFDDGCLVCIGCAYQGQHMKHTCKLVTDAKKEIECSLDISVKRIVSKSAEVSRKLQLLRDEQKSLKSQEDSLSHVVEESFKQLEEVVKRQKELQLEELQMHSEGTTSSMNSQIRMMEDKDTRVKSCLTDFATWQALPPKDALHDLLKLKSQLEKTGSMSTDVAKLNHPTAMSFVKPDYSELFAIVGNQGRLEFSAPSHGDTVNRDGEGLPSNDQEVLHVVDISSPNRKIDGKPPTKRKKLS